MKISVTLEEAQRTLADYCAPLHDNESIGILGSLGRTLAEDIIAGESIPPFDRSPLDGYAFRAEDTHEASKERPVVFEVIEEIQAGYAPQKAVSQGKAIKVMTGAPIPEGADAVIMYEKTHREGNRVSVFSSFKSGENIIRAGEDISQGKVVVRKGMVMTPPLQGLLASLGITEVRVYRRPKVAIVSTGDELLPIDKPLAPGKIRNSNGYSLSGYCLNLGAEPLLVGTAKDQVNEVAELIRRGLEHADLLLTTGGASVGDYDVVQDALREVGAELLYWKVNIKPGSPTMAAVKDGKLIIGLSGNPASAMVVFQLLGAPIIRKMAGLPDYELPRLEVVLKEDYPKASPARRFLRGRLVMEGSRLYMALTGEQGNSVLSSMIGSNVLAEVPAGSGPLKAGTTLTAFLTDSIT